ncbi:competence protein CoiA family protein [Cupriavidus taiwanensis]|uniref:Competence protein CoiA-like N-terminal domain-containing protein n=1 Tax=Cupriavidus taiwanensis TaxID=164546 RepID=A0A7Z7JFK1_9BURK|nr:competence protein CoiA family protein [Cupriavidus taiwanensis]SOZ17280.1 conserved hypothetical protein [Cupriavidus taiwanensis]SOZ96395.1 conserved hypothetical protein [Cupriavidus taiwanensis]SPC25659.1 conserved hypothetical protein [Cupriavidus taiwanensis]
MESEPTRPSALQDNLAYPPELFLHRGDMLVWALDGSGRLRYVDHVPNGKACGCFCPACREPLIARHGQILAHSFAHDSGAECRWAHEAILHHIAKHLIEKGGVFAVPPRHVVVRREGPIRPIVQETRSATAIVRPDSVGLENILFKHRPDIVLRIGERRLLVEIAVRNKVSSEKRAQLTARGYAAVEIDLTRDRPETVGDLAAILFGDDSRKQWLVNGKLDLERARLEQACETAFQEQVREHAEREEAKRVARSPVAQLVRTVPADATRFKTPDGSLWIRFVASNEVLIVVEDGARDILGELRMIATMRADNAFQVSKSTWIRLQRTSGATPV